MKRSYYPRTYVRRQFTKSVIFPAVSVPGQSIKILTPLTVYGRLTEARAREMVKHRHPEYNVVLHKIVYEKEERRMNTMDFLEHSEFHDNLTREEVYFVPEHQLTE